MAVDFIWQMSKRAPASPSDKEEPPKKKPRFEVHSPENTYFLIDHGPNRNKEDTSNDNNNDTNNETNNDINNESNKDIENNYDNNYQNTEKESAEDMQFESPDYSGASDGNSTEDDEQITKLMIEDDLSKMYTEDEENNNESMTSKEEQTEGEKEEKTEEEMQTEQQNNQETKKTVNTTAIQQSNTYSPYGTYIHQKPRKTDDYSSKKQGSYNQMQNWMSTEAINNLVNPKGKLLEYFQKTRQPLPQFEYSIRLSLGNKILKDKIWYPSAKEAEKQLSIEALTQLGTFPQELGLKPASKLSGYTLEDKSPVAKNTNVPSKKKEPKKEPKKIRGHPQIPSNIDFRDFLLNVLVLDSKKAPITLHPDTPKGDLNNWCLRIKVKCQIKSTPSKAGYHVSILMNNYLFYSDQTSFRSAKEAEVSVCKSTLSLLLQLREFIASPNSFPILRLGQEFFLTQNNGHPNDFFCCIPYTLQSTPVDSIALVLPFICRSLNCLINSKTGGTIHIGIAQDDNFTIRGIRTAWLNDLRSQVTTMVSGWLPRPGPGSYKWTVIPVYENQEIGVGVHYRDIGKVYEKMCWYKENNMDWDISPIIQFGLQAVWCVVLLEVPFGRPRELFCSQEGAFTRDFDEGREPVPIDKLSPAQRDYMSKQPSPAPPSSNPSFLTSTPNLVSSNPSIPTTAPTTLTNPNPNPNPYPTHQNPHMMYYTPQYSYYPPDSRTMTIQQQQHILTPSSTSMSSTTHQRRGSSRSGVSQTNRRPRGQRKP